MKKETIYTKYRYNEITNDLELIDIIEEYLKHDSINSKTLKNSLIDNDSVWDKIDNGEYKHGDIIIIKDTIIEEEYNNEYYEFMPLYSEE